MNSFLTDAFTKALYQDDAIPFSNYQPKPLNISSKWLKALHCSGKTLTLVAKDAHLGGVFRCNVVAPFRQMKVEWKWY